MSFRCDPATVARLEWDRLVECLAECAATSRGVEACRGDLFQATRASVLERLEETAEVRALLEAGEPLSFAGAVDLRDLLEALKRGRAVTAAALAGVRSTLDASARLRAFLLERRGSAPRLADLAGTLPELAPLSAEIARVISDEGEVRGDASPELVRLRKRVRELEGEIERRMAACLRNASLQPHLQDDYVTNREGRPVLPVRADARSRVPGIVHDVSSSGTTVFIEPEAVVEHGNRLRMARTEAEREVERLLRQLITRVESESSAIAATGATLEALDLAYAKGRLSLKLAASAPEIDGVLELRGLRHPLLLLEAGLAPDQVVANDVVLPQGVRGLVISGPNAGGKTVVAKAIGLAALAVRAGLEPPCDPGSRIPVFEAVCADIGDEQDLRAGLSTFSARMANLARIVSEADDGTLVIVDEVGDGTEPGEGAALAQSVLEALVERGATVIATTHFNRLKELAGGDERFANASAEFDPATLQPTYRIILGVPGSSGATWVAERMGLAPPVVARARELLDNDDRKLEALTRNLSELRQELEAERREATLGRERSESARQAYEARLAQLRASREQALAAMKADLETAFVGAREEIASVMRSLQAGRAEDGPAANRALGELHAIEERTTAAELAHDEPVERPRQLVDWKHVELGARVEIEGIRGEAVLLELPNSRGRVVVRVGSARTELPARRVLRTLEGVATPEAPRRAAHTEVERAPVSDEATPECDLRGLRVDEAIDRAEAHLHAVLGHGVAQVRFIHGHGTGALRSAIRSWLRTAPGVAGFQPGGEHEGGNGVTIASLSH